MKTDFLYFIPILFAVYFYLTFVRTALIKLNWTVLKDPDIKQKNLKDRVEKWLHNKDDYIFFLDIILTITILGLFLVSLFYLPIKDSKELLVLSAVILALLVISIKRRYIFILVGMLLSFCCLSACP